MAFRKTGDVPVQTVLCKCGGEIDSTTKQCKKCGKEWIKKGYEKEEKNES